MRAFQKTKPKMREFSRMALRPAMIIQHHALRSCMQAVPEQGSVQER